MKYFKAFHIDVLVGVLSDRKETNYDCVISHTYCKRTLQKARKQIVHCIYLF